MKATVFVEPGRIERVEKRIPGMDPNDALLRITTTTICSSDLIPGRLYATAGVLKVALKPN